MQAPQGGRIARFFGCQQTSPLACFWRCVLDLSLLLWVVRVPLAIVLVGFFLLGAAPQAQDLLLPLVDGQSWRVAFFFVLHFLFWAMPVHYAARIVINDDVRLYAYAKQYPSTYFNLLQRWVPRLLGAATFVALVVSAYRARSNLPIIHDIGVTDSLIHSLDLFMIWCAVALVVFLIYTSVRATLATRIRIPGADRLITRLRPLLQFLDFGKSQSAVAVGVPDHSEGGRLLLIFLFFIFVLVLLSAPSEVAELLPRAFAVSLILGGWVPILTYLSAIGRRLRAPLIVIAIGVTAILTVILGDHHDVRLLASKSGDTPSAQRTGLDLNQALKLWMQANQCDVEAQPCPRPVIIAAAGGASRAGFFTASVIGEFIDKSSNHGLTPAQVRDRVFAISGVSGGSVGAVMAVTAFAASGNDMRVPCPPQPFSPWYGEKIINWRGCLESLMSGDFLTPTFIGLAFHDVLPFGPWPDRATMIERAWERTFDAMRREAGNKEKLPCPADLECPFLSLQPSAQLWLPLLVLNGLSADSGQRLITTLFEPNYVAAEHCPLGGSAQSCPLFAETLLFHDLLTQTATTTNLLAQIERFLRLDTLLGRIHDDVRLSTAALNSARYVAVSPPGNIRSRNQYIIDRIVDGGYMENYGVITASELARAINAAVPKLRPFVLVISNDPTDPIGLPPPSAHVDTVDYLTDVDSFVGAFEGTQNTRGTMALEQLSGDLSVPAACAPSFAYIRVWPEPADPKEMGCPKTFRTNPRTVSESWWLSTPIQLRLIEQITGENTCNQSAIESFWRGLAMNSGCGGR
jgi:hypothetical protein